MIGNLHLWGTDLRCRHFSRFSSWTPSPRANSSTSSQSNVVPFMIVQTTDDLSACQLQFGVRPAIKKSLLLAMAEEAEEIAIHRRLKAHMRATRESRAWNQARMAVFLGVSQANYQKYESADPKRKVPFVVALRYCDNLGISLYDIIQPARRRA